MKEKNYTSAPSLIHWLQKQSKETLAVIWVDLNCRRWPNLIPTEFRPLWWDKKSPYYNEQDRRHGLSIILMEYCAVIAGETLIDLEWRKDQNIPQNNPATP